MDRDLRQTALFKEIEDHFHSLYSPAFGRISGAADPAPSPDGRFIAFTGSKLERLEGSPIRRVCLVDTTTGTVEEITGGPHDDHSPHWSPDGSSLAFLSDRAEQGHFQLYLLKATRLGEAVPTPPVEGTIEYLAWAPDGQSILLGVAGYGADLAGGQGSGTTAAAAAQDMPDWLPEVDSGPAANQWRRLWLYDPASGESRAVSRAGLNVWEAAWSGPGRLLAVVSQAPGEDAWYTAPLASIDCATGQEEILLESERQLALPAASPSGARLAVVQAVCSDRAVVAGDLLVRSGGDGSFQAVDTAGVDVTHLAWRNEDRLFYTGLRGLRTVYGEYDAVTGITEELWATDESSGSRYPTAEPVGSEGAFALVLQSYTRFPELAVVRAGRIDTTAILAHDGSAYLRRVGGTLETVRWQAPDGLEIEGLLVLPEGSGPHPLVVLVHGGPVWAYRNMWSMYYQWTPVLAAHGYAVLHPNPRGSGGRGQAFAEMVYGDMGGADTADILSGIEALVDRGLVDSHRVGVGGGSYGGFMAAWLVTQTDRFAAAVPMSPVTDWISTHYTSNIGYFDRIFLQDDPTNGTGRHVTRSPITYASRVRTPVLQTSGMLDRCTPPTQAVEFHRALLEQGAVTELVLYPGEGHGVRRFPGIIDQTTRIVGWFERFMPARKGS
jgi:dipeptidyl aminopeptidase/acylaminoacyl peptidase